MADNRPERLVAENVPEAARLRLRRFSSTQLCKKVIQELHPGMASDVLEKKAQGMSWALRSAFGYWDTESGGLNSKILSRYYALLQISIAEQIGSSDPADDLASIQRHTEHGHGLFTWTVNDGPAFPDNYLVGCLGSGHFSAYCKYAGIDLRPYIHGKKPRDFQSIDKSKAYSLSQLLGRVPELQGVVEEYINQRPQSFHVVAAASQNNVALQKRRDEYARKTGQVVFDPPTEGPTKITYVGIHPHGAAVTVEELESYDFPIRKFVAAYDELGKQDYFVGECEHPKEDFWWQHVETYKSGYSGTSLIVPFWGTTNAFLLHLTILYAFSIVVRYLPETWQAIESGQLDHIRSLLEHYIVIVDNVLPAVAVERLTKRRLLIATPGSMSAPI